MPTTIDSRTYLGCQTRLFAFEQDDQFWNGREFVTVASYREWLCCVFEAKDLEEELREHPELANANRVEVTITHTIAFK